MKIKWAKKGELKNILCGIKVLDLAMKNPEAQKLGSLGGKARAKKTTKAQRKKWGKLGGRPKNKVL